MEWIVYWLIKCHNRKKMFLCIQYICKRGLILLISLEMYTENIQLLLAFWSKSHQKARKADII